jgi:branched-chain amino acid transport system substrate-binding protein
VVALLAVAPLAACGSDDGPEGDAATLRIGVEAPLTGSQSELGEGMLRGAELAAAELNEGGGVLGRTVEIVPIDDAADPDTAADAANAAVVAGLDAVVGPYNSGTGVVSLPIYLDAGLVPLRLTSADSTAGLGFTLQPMTSQIAPVAVTAITEWAGAERVAIILDGTEEYTVGAARSIETQLVAAGAVVTSVVTIDPGADTYADAIERALADGPDAIYVVTYYPEAAAIAGDLASVDTDTECIVDYGGFDTGYITDAGVDTAQRCAVVGVPSPGDFPGSEDLVAAYTEKFDAPVGSWSPYTYDSVLLLADAIERAGTTDTDALTEALADTDGWSGWTGTVAFEAETGNRLPAPVTVNTVTAEGTFTVDQTWVDAVNFEF